MGDSYPLLIGYARVSSDHLSLTPQREALEAAGCPRVFTDVACGSTSERPGLKRAIGSASGGDVLVVVSLDRLACSLRQLVRTVDTLRQRDFGLRSLDDELDMSVPAGEDVARVFIALANFERESGRERTRKGRESARARGRLGGRPRSLDEEKRAKAIEIHKDPAMSPGHICKSLGISKSTLYRHLAADQGSQR